MSNILIVKVKQEFSSFNPVPYHFHDFDIPHGNNILALHRGSQNEVAVHWVYSTVVRTLPFYT